MGGAESQGEDRRPIKHVTCDNYRRKMNVTVGFISNCDNQVTLCVCFSSLLLLLPASEELMEALQR